MKMPSKKNPLPRIFGNRLAYRVIASGYGTTWAPTYHSSLASAIGAAMEFEMAPVEGKAWESWAINVEISLRVNDRRERIAIRTRSGFVTLPVAALDCYRDAQLRAAEALEEVVVLEQHTEALRLALASNAGGTPVEDLGAPDPRPDHPDYVKKPLEIPAHVSDVARVDNAQPQKEGR